MNPEDVQPTDHEPRPLSTGRDSRLESFIRQAAPILAAERGMNEMSRLKLQALADNLHLPADLYERAVLELKQRDSYARLTRTERQFASFLAKELPNLSDQILTAQLESKAIEIAATKYQIKPERARELIREQAADLAFVRVSRSDAEQYVEHMCDDLLGDAATFSPNQMRRILEFGGFWGLTHEQCQAIAVGVAELRKQNERRDNRVWKVVAGVIVAAILVTGGALWFVFGAGPLPHARRSDAKIDRATVGGNDAIVATAPWWPAELARQVVTSVEAAPGSRGDFEAAASSDGAVRTNALLRMASPNYARQAGWPGPPTKLLAAIVSADPDEHVIQDTVTEWCARLGPQNSSTVATPDSLATAEAAARTLVEVWRVATVPAIRRLIEESFFDNYRVSLVPTSPPDALERSWTSAQAAEYWNHLIEACSTEPRGSLTLFNALRAHVSASEHRSLERDYLSVMLRNQPSLWPQCETALAEQISEGSNDELLMWLESIDGEQVPELAQFVYERIAARLGAKLPDGGLEASAQVLRRALTPLGPRESELAKRWDIVREKNLALIRGPAHEALDEPRRIYNAAWVAGLALELDSASLTDTGDFARFDALLSGETIRWPELDRPVAEDVFMYRRVSKPATAIEREQRDRATHKIADPSANATSKLQALSALAEIGDRFPDIPYPDAVEIVSFMLDDGDPDALVEFERCAQRLRHWPNLALALADHLRFTSAPADHVFSVYVALMGDTPRIDRQSDWRLELNLLALKSIDERIEETLRLSSGGESSQWRRLEFQLRELLSRRDTPSPDRRSSSAETGNPNRAIIEQQVRRIRQTLARRDPGDTQSIDRLAELVEVRFENELAQIVFLEELLAQALGTMPADSIVRPPTRSAANRQTLARRLYAAETAIVEHLLARHPGETR